MEMGKGIPYLVNRLANRVMRRGDPMALHEFFGEALARLELSGGASGAKRAPSAELEFIDHTQGKWQFRPDDRQVGFHALGHGHEGVHALHISRKALGLLRDPSVAGRAIDLADAWRLAQLPDEGMLTSATADDENFHNSGQTRLGIGDGDVKLPKRS